MIKEIKLLILLILLTAYFLSGTENEFVSVNLLDYPNLDNFILRLEDNSEVIINNKNMEIKAMTIFPKKKIVSTEKGEYFSIDEIITRSSGTTVIDCLKDKQEYKGDFIINFKNDTLMVVNKVPINDYFAAVLGAEMGGGFSVETLKAMAVSIRTYFYSKKNVYKNQSFDINNIDGVDMVYKGSRYATKKMYDAFNKTEDLFLVDKHNHIATPLFHSTSGGVILKDKALTSGYNDNIGNAVLTVDKDKYNVPLSINSPYFVFLPEPR